MTSVSENLEYKSDDHRFRSNDEYAQGKYDVTTRWLLPRLRPGQVLLNIGCGGGEYNSAAHAMGLEVIACEPEVGAYELAAASAPPGSRVLNCGLMELTGQVAPAHFIVMHDVLEHIEDEVAAIDQVWSLLVPGGIAVISVPAYQWLFGHHDVQLGHYRRYTKKKLLDLVRARFEIEAARYYGAALIPVALWFSRIAKRSYPVASASRGLARDAMRAVCQLEAKVPMPMGTSVMIRIRKPELARPS